MRYFQFTILNLMGVPSKVYETFNPEHKELAQEMFDRGNA